ncbi:MAG TPA: TetR/AcrR family transcriptional regulator [Caulobacteraceae bacterium]|nr:TetR/AcrR family transcriptional regulator [Caulobacteraceae bacterium]
MRYAADHKDRTRQRLLVEAAKAIRRDGPDKVSVAGVMSAAGLTHGGFYAHFASRDDLIAEAVSQMFREGAERLVQAQQGRGPREALRDYVDFYLSPAHRDARTAGCPLPFLSADAPRLSSQVRDRFAEGVRDLEAALRQLLSALDRQPAEAGSLLAEMAGALALARAEPDRTRADAMLERSKASLVSRFGLAA